METVIYEKARWHLEGDWPEGLPESQAYVIGGMLMGWLAERGLLESLYENYTKIAAQFDKRLSEWRELER